MARKYTLAEIRGDAWDSSSEVLSSEEEEILIKQLNDEQSKEAEYALIEHNLRLVVYIARKFERSFDETDELISIGTIRLIKAVQTFKPEKGTRLASYARRCIENEMLMHLRVLSKHKNTVSLDEPLFNDENGGKLCVSDTLVVDGDEVSQRLEDEAERDMVREAVKKLKEKERKVLGLRYGLYGETGDLTQRDIADLLGVTQGYVCRVEKLGLQHLKEELGQYPYYN